MQAAWHAGNLRKLQRFEIWGSILNFPCKVIEIIRRIFDGFLEMFILFRVSLCIFQILNLQLQMLLTFSIFNRFQY